MQLGSPGMDGRIILKWILGKVWECVDCIHVAQDRDKWLAVVKMEINHRIP
jgi:hypothetical protein